MVTDSLQAILKETRNEETALVEFARAVFAGEEHLLSLVQGAHSTPISAASPEVSSYVRDAVLVIREAIQVNPDESVVTRWFHHERLPLFENKTPAEVIATGRRDALVAYIRSLDAGWTA